MTKSVLLAGILGGVLGGALSFAANRWLVPVGTGGPAKAQPAAGVAVPDDARAAVEFYVKKLQDMKYDEFKNEAARAVFYDDAEAKQFKDRFTEFRTRYHGVNGNLAGDMELLRETALSPDLVQFVYLERFQTGGLVWFFTFYQTNQKGEKRWRLHNVFWDPNLGRAFQLGS